MIEFIKSFLKLDEEYVVTGDDFAGLIILFACVVLSFIFFVIAVIAADARRTKELKKIKKELVIKHGAAEGANAENLGFVGGAKIKTTLDDYVILPKDAEKDTRSYKDSLHGLTKIQQSAISAFTKKALEYDHITTYESGPKLVFKHKSKKIAEVEITFDKAVIRVWVQNKSLLSESIKLKPLKYPVKDNLDMEELLFSFDVAHNIFHEIQFKGKK